MVWPGRGTPSGGRGGRPVPDVHIRGAGGVTTLSDVLTFLLIEFAPDDASATGGIRPAEVVHRAVQAAGGELVDDPGAPPSTLSARFHIAGDAAQAAVQVARALQPVP